jgi:hypothetical protein
MTVIVVLLPSKILNGAGLNGVGPAGGRGKNQ